MNTTRGDIKAGFGNVYINTLQFCIFHIIGHTMLGLKGLMKLWRSWTNGKCSICVHNVKHIFICRYTYISIFMLLPLFPGKQIHHVLAWIIERHMQTLMHLALWQMLHVCKKALRFFHQMHACCCVIIFSLAPMRT